jgi:aryl-alcohol dehydrogenase-like predicted oxidoreductase
MLLYEQMNTCCQLALGTVQFGLDYGVSNPSGKVHIDEVGRILDFARQSGIKVLDTAQAYGDSERVLGQFNLSSFSVISKMMQDGHLEESLANLKLPAIHAVMFHREDDVHDLSWNQFEKYKTQKLVNKIGVSVYSPSKLELLMTNYPIDIVQLPMNILDQRFLHLLPALKQRGIEVHTRSAFLQGLLLMDTSRLDAYFKPILSMLSQIPQPRIAHALHFLKQQADIDSIVVGVTKEDELREIVEHFKTTPSEMNYSHFRIDDERFINPSLWRYNK